MLGGVAAATYATGLRDCGYSIEQCPNDMILLVGRQGWGNAEGWPSTGPIAPRVGIQIRLADTPGRAIRRRTLGSWRSSKKLPAHAERASRPTCPRASRYEIWWQDEARIGQENGIVRQWARAVEPGPPAGGSALQRHLPGARRRRRSGASLRRYRGHAVPHRRDQPSRRTRRARRTAHGPCRVAHHRKARYAQEHHTDLPAVTRPGTEPGRKRLAIHARKLALEPRLRRLRRHHRRRLRAWRKLLLSPTPSHPLERATGPTSVNPNDRWYNILPKPFRGF